MIIPTFYGKIKEGKLQFDNPTELSMWLSYLNDSEVQVKIEKRKRVRSLNQNSYYWGVVIKILGNHFGYWDDEMHEALKFQFLRVHREGKPDTVKSTAKLSTTEMEEYLEKIRLWASAEFSVFIPEPNENIWE